MARFTGKRVVITRAPAASGWRARGASPPKEGSWG